jgi:hypothetical protein
VISAVNVHDFPTQSVGKAIPYGTYDLTRDEAAVNIGNMIDPRGKIRCTARARTICTDTVPCSLGPPSPEESANTS